MTAAAGILDEAYQRLHLTGPEWGGNLSNHGPMAVEVLARHDRPDLIPGWLDAYSRRLREMPSPSDPVTDGTWREALGARVADWVSYLSRQASERPWQDLLATWWPRLLPGIAAGATHGVIRTGHAVRTLLAGNESPAALAELAHGLAFWAARYRAVPGMGAPSGRLDPGDALDAAVRIAVQAGPIRIRFDSLARHSGWPGSLAALRPAADADAVPEVLTELVTAATVRYLRYGPASPVLLVHTATAPNAVYHALPALPRTMWKPSLAAAWAASAAITATYAPGSRRGPGHQVPAAPAAADPVAEVLDRACDNGDEHALKFADTAAEAYARSGNPDTLAAAILASQLLGARA